MSCQFPWKWKHCFRSGSGSPFLASSLHKECFRGCSRSRGGWEDQPADSSAQPGQDAKDRAGLTQGGAPLFIILQTHVQLVLCAR